VTGRGRALQGRFMVALMFAASAAAPAFSAQDGASSHGSPEAGAPPAYVVDPSWPRLPLPDKWLIGDVGGVSIDRQGHVWIVHRPGSLRDIDVQANAETPTKCCVAAPPVIEFDAQGNVLRGWGGPELTSDWFNSEHSIFVDARDNVWIVGAGAGDGQVLKFSADGELLLRIGRKGDFVKADDPSMLGMPTDIYVDTERGEAFVSDGYRNHRLIVFDSESGAFKRQWTAFGKAVDPAYAHNPGEDGFSAQGHDPERFTTVHCVTMIGGELHVCDRANDRLQVFTPQGAFIREIHFNRGLSGKVGAMWDAVPFRATMTWSSCWTA